MGGTEWSYKSDGRKRGDNQGSCQVEYRCLKARVAVAAGDLVRFGLVVVVEQSREQSKNQDYNNGKRNRREPLLHAPFWMRESHLVVPREAVSRTRRPQPLQFASLIELNCHCR